MPSSSRAIETLTPWGVAVLYRVISGDEAIVLSNWENCLLYRESVQILVNVWWEKRQGCENDLTRGCQSTIYATRWKIALFV